MKACFFIITLSLTNLFAQPKEGVEFKLNTISGYVIDSLSSKPIMDVNVDIYTGSGVLKHSTITDEFGYYERPIVGYLWKPKVKFSLHNYYKKALRLDPAKLDSNLNMNVNAMMLPVPEEKRIPDLTKSTITNRAETFFIIGNVFYYLIDQNNADRIIIETAEAIESSPGFILMKVNGAHYDIARCYVPQEGKYENLSFIMKSLLADTIFEKSKHPLYLDQTLLKPSVIYGYVMNILTGDPVMGAEIIITEPFKRRISDETGKFAFHINDSGRYDVIMNPPPHYKRVSFARPEIIIDQGRGGWFKSNFYVRP
tara:strand:+ start:5083 stop:6018 length:936 start_codon:yes stop_codon:yes gene_type:complete